MIRVLHISGCGDAGGISSVIRNYYQFIDREKIHFDLALTVPEAGQNAHALETMGANVFFLPLKSENMEGFRRELTNLLTEGHYDAVHVHESETCYVAIQLAKKLRIPCRIAHAHTTVPYEGLRSIVKRWSGCLLNYPCATHVIGCGQKAGERVFGKYNMKRPKALVLPNAVDTERFAFDSNVRQQTRCELGVDGRFVLGMVARLSYQKNVPFAVELMHKLKDRMPEAVLCIAGNGEDEPQIRQQIRSLHLENQVMLLGRRQDVERLYGAFDVFLMPSYSEGFPVAAVEALSSGLPVLISDRVTDELISFSGARYLSIKEPETWIQALESWKEDNNRALRQKEVRQRGLDIRENARILQKLYEQDVAAGK